MKYYVYIIRSIKDNKHYVGMTNNLSRRLEEHNIGKKGTPTTFGRGPFRLIRAEECTDIKQARDREIFWKSGKGRETRDKLFKTWWM